MQKNLGGNIPRCRFKIKRDVFVAAIQNDDKPKRFQEAHSSTIKKEWINTMAEEMKSMKINHMWNLVDVPLECKIIGNKWVLKVKYKVDDSIDKYKAHLVVKGYTQ